MIKSTQYLPPDTRCILSRYLVLGAHEFVWRLGSICAERLAKNKGWSKMISTKRSAMDDLLKEEKLICLEKEKENVNIEKLKSGEFMEWFRLDAIPQDWKEALVEKESKKEYWKRLMMRLMAEDLNKSLVIYPNPQDRFSFMTLSLQNIKIVILGQDPYHGPNQAHGLSFSVQKGIKIPPSLVNIYKELQNDLGVETFGKDLPNHGYLKEWHDQGVLMLNATLTVQKTRPNSHAKYGWQNFTGLFFILNLILLANLV